MGLLIILNKDDVKLLKFHWEILKKIWINLKRQ